MFNIGIIGLGFMAAAHIKAYRLIPGARITAICNPSGRNLDGDLTKVGGNVGDPNGIRLDMSEVTAYRDPAALLADPNVQIVDVCTPTRTHVSIGLAAIAAGKPMMIEKPLARTSAEAHRLASAAALSGVIAMPAMCMRFWPEWAWLKEAIDSGRYGSVRAARFRRVAEPPAWGHTHFFNGADSGGALLDLHVHDVDFIQFCFGRPRRVTASGFRQVSGAIDHVVALIETAGGATVSAEGSWCMAPGYGFHMEYTVNFEQATADYNLDRGADALKLFTPGQAPQVLRPSGGDGYVGELTYFLDCVRHGRAPRTVTLADGATAVEICEAEERSIVTGKPVELSNVGTGK